MSVEDTNTQSVTGTAAARRAQPRSQTPDWFININVCLIILPNTALSTQGWRGL